MTRRAYDHDAVVQLHPDGLPSTWRLKSAAAGGVWPSEQDHVAELIAHH